MYTVLSCINRFSIKQLNYFIKMDINCLIKYSDLNDFIIDFFY
jgi:Ulp1 family protease